MFRLLCWLGINHLPWNEVQPRSKHQVAWACGHAKEVM